MIYFKDNFSKRLSFLNSVFRSVFFLIFLGLSIGSRANYDLGLTEYHKKNFSLAFVEFEKAAWEGDARAQTALALMHKYGEGTTLDLNVAFEWNLKAAELGHAPAQYNAGIMLLDGVGVERNERKGSEFIALAAEQGFARAIERLRSDKIEIVKTENPSWSRNWDLRVPNHARFSMPSNHPQPEKRFKIQLGAMSSKKKAEILWNDILKGNKALLSELAANVERVEQASNIIWRLRVGDFKTKENATEICARLLEGDKNNSGCLVITDQPREAGHNMRSQ